jgi:hypothetical protein
MTPEQKLQIKGLTAVGIILFAAAIVLAFFFQDMAQNTLMGASDRYRPNYPAVPVTDITKAPQCAEGYDKTWVGCQKLAQ